MSQRTHTLYQPNSRATHYHVSGTSELESFDVACESFYWKVICIEGRPIPNRFDELCHVGLKSFTESAKH